MSTYIWLIILAVIALGIYLWYKYGNLISWISSNGSLINVAKSVSRYETDIEGLVGAFDSASDNKGSFFSRLGSFFGKLPT